MAQKSLASERQLWYHNYCASLCVSLSLRGRGIKTAGVAAQALPSRGLWRNGAANRCAIIAHGQRYKRFIKIYVLYLVGLLLSLVLLLLLLLFLFRCCCCWFVLSVFRSVSVTIRAFYSCCDTGFLLRCVLSVSVAIRTFCCAACFLFLLRYGLSAALRAFCFCCDTGFQLRCRLSVSVALRVL